MWCREQGEHMVHVKNGRGMRGVLQEGWGWGKAGKRDQHMARIELLRPFGLGLGCGAVGGPRERRKNTAQL